MADLAASNDGRLVSDEYPLTHSARETKRLIDQSDLMEAVTRRLLEDAGISPGMRVLDLGSGAGDVAFLAAGLVGDQGEIVGLDKSPMILDVARRRAAQQGLANVSFIEGDLATAEPPGEFDAVIGRLILMYQPDPAATIRRFLPFVRSGGSVAFVEYDFGQVVAVPAVPQQTKILDWWRATTQSVGAEFRMGPKLYRAMIDAGLPVPQMIAEAVIGGAEQSPAPAIWTEVLRAVTPVMLKLGIVTEAELDIETLEERFRAEAVALGSCLSSPLMVGAWSRVP
jgi:ubiquinone/menaquinone biosynthesis C-methylase UbiE